MQWIDANGTNPPADALAGEPGGRAPRWSGDRRQRIGLRLERRDLRGDQAMAG